MIRRLLVLLVAALAGWWWLRRRSGGAQHAAARRSGTAASTAEEPMVRDRVCNTFLPRSRALVLSDGGETLYFCSEACRARHAGAAAPHSNPSQSSV